MEILVILLQVSEVLYIFGWIIETLILRILHLYGVLLDILRVIKSTILVYSRHLAKDLGGIDVIWERGDTILPKLLTQLVVEATSLLLFLESESLLFKLVEV